MRSWSCWSCCFGLLFIARLGRAILFLANLRIFIPVFLVVLCTFFSLFAILVLLLFCSVVDADLLALFLAVCLCLLASDIGLLLFSPLLAQLFFFRVRDPLRCDLLLGLFDCRESVSEVEQSSKTHSAPNL